MGKRAPPRRRKDRETNKIKRLYDDLADHYLVVLLFLSLLTLTLTGVGNTAVVSALGAALCLAGCIQGAVTVDLWVLLPLLVFDVLGMASSYHAYGTISAGFVPIQTIFTALYLLMAYLTDQERFSLRKLCVLWAGGTAALGIVQFTIRAQTFHVGRLGGLLGNPNVFGIFLVVSWFALLAGQNEDSGYLKRLEPVILAALAMTLSMGSFLAMAAGILISCLMDWCGNGLRLAASRACQTMARAVVGMGIGLLVYIAGRKTDASWLCILLALYLMAAAMDWENFSSFLRERPLMSWLLTGAGIIVAGAVVLLRPSAAATFAERLEMIRANLRYLAVNPLLGVGPYQWQLLDYNDGGTFFNTWYIHNLFLHIGVELGVVAMAALAAVTIRHFLKRGEPETRVGSAALLVHCMMDVGFFYAAVPTLAILTAGHPREGGRRLGPVLSRCLFSLLGAVFVWNLLHPQT